jgi:hypothetical protein
MEENERRQTMGKVKEGSNGRNKVKEVKKQSEVKGAEEVKEEFDGTSKEGRKEGRREGRVPGKPHR